MKILYYERCLDQDDAIRRGKYLKSALGKRHLKNRLRSYLRGKDAKPTTIYTHVLNRARRAFAVRWTGFEATYGGYYTDPHKMPR